jgi:hypothetical protein
MKSKNAVINERKEACYSDVNNNNKNICESIDLSKQQRTKTDQSNNAYESKN